MPENKKEVIFPNGIIFKKPREGVPEYVKGHLSFKVDEACSFLQEHANSGWVNLDIKMSKEKKLYLQLNTWKKEETPKAEEPKEETPFS